MNAFPPAPRLLSGFSEIADGYSNVLSDVWGVVHDGVRAHREACEAWIRYRERGGVVVLITNAPRPGVSIVAQLDGYGAPRACYDAVVSSGDVTLALMRERGAAPVYFVGPPRDQALFVELGASGAPVPAQVGIDEAAYAVISGLRDDERETLADYENELSAMRARGLDLVCANPDLVVHRGDDLLYCAGALAARYEELGGRVAYAGKPHGPIYDLARQAAAAARRRRNLPSADATLCVGDAVRTDLAGAVAQGLDCLFITDGIHRDGFVRADGSLDETALAGVFDGAGMYPIAAMRMLAW